MFPAFDYRLARRETLNDFKTSSRRKSTFLSIDKNSGI